MARTPRRKRKARKGGRWGRWLVVLGLALLAGALPAYRAWWRWGDRSALREGLALLETQACAACHAGSEGWRWRADGGSPVSLETIRDALVEGRPEVPGFAPRMPRYGRRLRAGAVTRLVTAVGALEGLVGVPEDPELAAGHDVAVQMGCFRCHGVLGAGGVPNPGSLTGEVPGWLGRSLRSGRSRIAAIIRDGSEPAPVPFPGLPRPLLVMPAFGTRLDSTELALLEGYVTWLADHPPGPR